MAAAPGFANSFAWGLYIINTAPPDPPVFIPPPGVYIQSVDVTLFDDSNGAKIYYNLGGSPPDSNSTPYTGPIHITTNTTVSAIAYIGELASGVIGGEYDINGPPAEIPAFDPPAGPYKSIQSVTLSDSTPGATIYFTTDGSHPTVSSTPYTTPIAVASSETIEAIAVAPGYSTSAIGAAQYTLNLPPPAFALGANAGSLTINSGGQGNVTLTVTPQNGFNSAVTFACSGQPSSVTCSFNPATVTPAGSAGTTTLTFAAAASASAQHSRNPLLPAATLALAACAFLRMRRHNLRNLLLLLIFAISLETLTACGGGGRNSGRGGGGGSTTATVTVTATSGSLQQTTTISLTLN
jgi:hypothetical protein